LPERVDRPGAASKACRTPRQDGLRQVSFEIGGGRIRSYLLKEELNMGEIIVKVPGDVKEVFTVIDEAIKKLIEIKKIEEQNQALDFILKNVGKLPKNFKITDEELHMQGD